MKEASHSSSRRRFITQASVIALGSAIPLKLMAEDATKKKEPVIDIHQHIHYHARTDEQMMAHQLAMGVTTTILLPEDRLILLPHTRGYPMGYRHRLEAMQRVSCLLKNIKNSIALVCVPYRMHPTRCMKLKNM